MEAGTGAGLFIGACVTLTELLKHPAIPELLKLAAAEMAAPGIRNIATLGGNICNASPAGDTLPPLYVLEAEVVLLSLRGRRILPIAEFILGPGKTCLAPDELLTEVLLPPLPDGARWVYRKAGTRKAQALSKVSLAALFASRAENSGRPPQITEAAGPKNAEARIALGAVAPTVFRSKELEARLAGLAPNGNLQRITEIAAAYGAAVAPIDDQRSTADYRRRTAARLVEWAAGESFIK
jgi:CO/xanthine dehydrogenase FAD-binding subunit